MILDTKMDWLIIIILAVVGYWLYTKYSGTNEKRRTPSAMQQNRRSAPSRSPPAQPVENKGESLLQQGKYEEAAEYYIQNKKIFLAAAALSNKGPSYALQIISMVRNHMPDAYLKVIDNLVSDQYYSNNRPAMAAALLRGVGKVDEASAIEITAGINSTAHFVEPVMTKQQARVTEQTAMNYSEAAYQQPTSSETVFAKPDFVEPEAPVEETFEPGKYPNGILVAARDTGDKCLVCKREIKAGETYLHCLNCGKIGHVKHLREYMKISGKCPSCKAKLNINMYELD